MVQVNSFSKQKQRHRRAEQKYGHQGGKVEWTGRRGLAYVLSVDTTYKMDNWRCPPVEHREPCSLLCGDLRGRKSKEGAYEYIWLIHCVLQPKCSIVNQLYSNKIFWKKSLLLQLHCLIKWSHSLIACESIKIHCLQWIS